MYIYVHTHTHTHASVDAVVLEELRLGGNAMHIITHIFKKKNCRCSGT